MPSIPIDCGRQLFVDDHLIAENTGTRTYHAARVHPASPVLAPQTPVELNAGRCPCACPFNDGVWYDPQDRLYKLWYHAGWMDGVALAVSRDGLAWERPAFDVVPGTNLVMRPSGARRDGCVVWIDSDTTDPAQRFKMFLYVRQAVGKGEGGAFYISPDGIHWQAIGDTPPCGDNTSFYYDPFRRRFVMSIRRGWRERQRYHYAAPTFAEAGRWPETGPVFWLRIDEHDRADPTLGDVPQLYDFNAVAYESLMLGAFGIFYGPQNEVCERTGQVKAIDLHLGYSRDGFTWFRPPERTPFLACSRRPGDWDYGYLHAAGGLCCVVGDELRFYFAAFSGQSVLQPGQSGDFQAQNKMYAGGSTGLAVLRRDGFASVGTRESATLTTHPVSFSGGWLFINAAAPQGEVRVAVTDEQGVSIPGFGAQDCTPVRGDATRQAVQWPGADLRTLAGRPVRFRFQLQQAELFSFWVSRSPRGESGGYLAAGGPEGFRDLPV